VATTGLQGGQEERLEAARGGRGRAVEGGMEEVGELKVKCRSVNSCESTWAPYLV